MQNNLKELGCSRVHPHLVINETCKLRIRHQDEVSHFGTVYHSMQACQALKWQDS